MRLCLVATSMVICRRSVGALYHRGGNVKTPLGAGALWIVAAMSTVDTRSQPRDPSFQLCHPPLSARRRQLAEMLPRVGAWRRRLAHTSLEVAATTTRPAARRFACPRQQMLLTLNDADPAERGRYIEGSSNVHMAVQCSVREMGEINVEDGTGTEKGNVDPRLCCFFFRPHRLGAWRA